MAFSPRLARFEAHPLPLTPFPGLGHLVPEPRGGFPSLCSVTSAAGPLLWRHRGWSPSNLEEKTLWPRSRRLPRKRRRSRRHARDAQVHRADRACAERPQGEGQRARTSVSSRARTALNWRQLEPDLQEHRRAIHFSVSLSAPEFGTIYGNVLRARRRPGEEGHHLEPRQLTPALRPRVSRGAGDSLVLAAANSFSACVRCALLEP